MNYIKKLIPLAAAAVVCLFGMKASALPNGYEAVNFQAKLTLQMSQIPAKIKTVSMGNKDILNLIRGEFISTPIPNGAVLVSRGLDGGGLAVLSSDNVLLSDVTTNPAAADQYELNLSAYNDQHTMSEKGNKNVYDYTSDQCTFTYTSADGSHYVSLEGTMTIEDNFQFYSETFKLANGSGSFNLPLDGEDVGTLTGSVSGSGKDVECFGIPFFVP